MGKKKINSKEISDKISIHFPEGLSDVNYNFESYQSNIINELIDDNTKLKDFIREIISVYINEIDYEDVKRAKELLDGGSE